LLCVTWYLTVGMFVKRMDVSYVLMGWRLAEMYFVFKFFTFLYTCT